MGGAVAVVAGGKKKKKKHKKRRKNAWPPYPIVPEFDGPFAEGRDCPICLGEFTPDCMVTVL